MVMKVGMPVFDVSVYILSISFDDNFLSVRPFLKNDTIHMKENSRYRQH
jgi:hypothetical protein